MKTAADAGAKPRRQCPRASRRAGAKHRCGRRRCRRSDAGPAAPVPVAGPGRRDRRAGQAGKKRFEIRLDPPELGRIDVRLEIDSDGQVKSRLIVERSETLDMLRRDAPQLERALQQAGLKTSDNALEFSLRHQAPQRDDAKSAERRAARRGRR